jgi:hypothetical protein
MMSLLSGDVTILTLARPGKEFDRNHDRGTRSNALGLARSAQEVSIHTAKDTLLSGGIFL